MNSGTGTNDGIFRINFDDGNKVRFCSAGGEVSGLTYGDRKFNIQGKGNIFVIFSILLVRTLELLCRDCFQSL